MDFASELLDPFNGGRDMTPPERVDATMDAYLQARGYKPVPDREFIYYTKTIPQPRHIGDCVLTLRLNLANRLWTLRACMTDNDTGVLLEMSAIFRRSDLLAADRLALTEVSLVSVWSRWTPFDHSDME